MTIPEAAVASKQGIKAQLITFALCGGFQEERMRVGLTETKRCTLCLRITLIIVAKSDPSHCRCSKLQIYSWIQRLLSHY